MHEFNLQKHKRQIPLGTLRKAVEQELFRAGVRSPLCEAH